VFGNRLLHHRTGRRYEVMVFAWAGRHGQGVNHAKRIAKREKSIGHRLLKSGYLATRHGFLGPYVYHQRVSRAEWRD
jgi:hypothetical protein